MLERVFKNTHIYNYFECDYSDKVTSWVVFDNMEDTKKMERYREAFTGISFTAGKFLMHKTLMPDGDFLVNWEMIYNIAAVIGAIVIPARGFVGPMHWGIAIPLYIILYSIYIITIYLRFHVCYYNKKQILISHPIYTAKHYLYGSFPVDLIAILPVSELIHFLNKPNTATVAKFACLSKLLLLYRFPEIHFKRDMQQRNKLIYDLLHFVSLAAVLIVNGGYILHFITLKIGAKHLYMNNYLKTYYLLDLAIKVDNSFNKSLQDLPSDKFIIQSPWYLYLYSMYWSSMLLMGTGTGIIFFKSNSYYIYNILATIIGYFFNIWMVAKYCSKQIQINKECTDFRGSIQELMNMMKREKISLSLRKKIFNHFEYIFTRTYGLNTTSILLQCSFPLQQSLTKSMYSETLFMVSVFNGMPNAFWRMVAIICSEQHYLMDTPIFLVNDIIDSIYIVHSGTIQINAADGTALEFLQRGCMFGNMDTSANIRSMISAIPSKNADILSIKSTEFFKAINQYPVVKRRILKYISTESMFYILSSDFTSSPATKIRQSVLKRRSKRMFLVSSYYKAIIVVASLVTYSSTIYKIAFVTNTTRDRFRTGYIMLIYDSYKIGFYILEALHLIITLFGFLTPVLIKGELVFNTRIISRMYLKSSLFIISVIALMPIYEISRVFVDDLFYTRYLLLNRAIRLYIVHKYLNTMRNKLNVNMALETILSTTVHAIITVHTMVCFTYWATIFDDPQISWFNSNVCGDSYVCSTYYVTSVITGVGFITIRASSPADIILFIVLAFSGRIMVAILIGNLCSAVKHMKYQFYKFVDARCQLLLYLCDKVSKPLLKYCVNYYNQLWLVKSAHQLPVLLEKAPPILVEALLTEAFGHHIYNNAMFMHCHRDFQRLLIRAIKMETYFPGNVIMKQGAEGNRLFLIHRGLVEVIHEEGTEDIVVDVLEAGDSFGILEFLFSNQEQTHTFKAIIVTEVLSISAEELKSLLQFYPAAKYTIYEVFKDIDISSLNTSSLNWS